MWFLAILGLAYALLPIVLVIWVVNLGRRIVALENTIAGRTIPGPEGFGTAETATGEDQAPTDEASVPGAAGETLELPDLQPSGLLPVAPGAADPWSPGTVAASVSATPAAPEVGADQNGADSSQERPIVLRADRFGDLARWLRENWFYAVSAASLALAGIFLVQYSVERGLLPPSARIVLALLFGAALVVAGEVIRRRSVSGDADEPASTTAYLPSTFSGAGLVVMFAAILAARQLYGLIGVEAAFAMLVAVAALALVLGWFYGPMLAAVGLIGSGAAPFVVGGSTDQPGWLYGYILLIAVTGLGVDAVRRWAWISVLALVVGYGGFWLLLQGTGGQGWFTLAATALALLAIAVPVLRLAPDHQGPMLSEFMLGGSGGEWPGFPTRLAGGAMLATGLLIGAVPLALATPAEDALVFACLGLLTLAIALWAERAPALADLALIPAVLFLLRIAAGIDGSVLGLHYAAQAISLRLPETAGPQTVSWLMAMALAITLSAAWRSLAQRDHPVPWGLAAVLFAPLAAVLFELRWLPALVIGPTLWATHVMALAALMVALAERYARRDGSDHARMAYATLSALSLVALALFIMTAAGPLTLALAVLVVVAAALDRRFGLPQMVVFLQAGVAVLGWRLVVDPGVGWALEGPLWQVIVTFGGLMAALSAGLWTLAPLERPTGKAVLESALAGFAALFANVLILRWAEDRFGPVLEPTHWLVSLNAMPWVVMALVQAYRTKIGGSLQVVRFGLGALAGLIGGLGLLSALSVLNPLIPGNPVAGPWVFDTLSLAYALPALVLLLALPFLSHLPRLLCRVLAGAGAVLLVIWAGLEIRHFWRGADLSLPGIGQPELYSYTVALMLAGAVLLYLAIARRSALLQRAAMAVIGLTVVKVFLIDAAGLSGLTRVFSFLALGLSLAGLAWLNRWAAAQRKGEADAPTDA